MIIYHIEYDPITGEIDPSACYDDVDTSFIEAEGREIKELLKKEQD